MNLIWHWLATWPLSSSGNEEKPWHSQHTQNSRTTMTECPSRHTADNPKQRFKKDAGSSNPKPRPWRTNSSLSYVSKRQEQFNKRWHRNDNTRSFEVVQSWEAFTGEGDGLTIILLRNLSNLRERRREWIEWEIIAIKREWMQENRWL